MFIRVTRSSGLYAYYTVFLGVVKGRRDLNLFRFGRLPGIWQSLAFGGRGVGSGVRLLLAVGTVARPSSGFDNSSRAMAGEGEKEACQEVRDLWVAVDEWISVCASGGDHISQPTDVSGLAKIICYPQ